MIFGQSCAYLGLTVEAEIQISNRIYPPSIENKLAAINFALYEVATFFLYRYWYMYYVLRTPMQIYER